MNKKPSFFIVGAPKCGTTALNEYLKCHPDIFMPEKKEPHFFGSDLQSSWFTRDFNEYTKLFSSWGNQKIAGEASVWYLYSKNAAKEIKEFSENSKIIIMLRNPVDMLYSLYFQMLYTGNEEVDSFEKALLLEESRKNGKNIPTTSHFIKSLYYTETASYYEQVMRYYNHFSPENIHIIIYDDFKNNPSLVYENVLQFLGVRTNISMDFKIINSNKVIHSKFLNKVLRNKINPDVIKLLLPFKSLRSIIRQKLMRLNTKQEVRKPMDLELRKKLVSQFRLDISKLGKLLNRDLSYWTSN